MTLPIVEQISAQLETRIRAISMIGGYNFDYVNLAAEEIRTRENIHEVNEFPRLYVPADDEGQAGAFTAGAVDVNKNEREIQLSVVGYVQCDDSDTALNKVRQDIERAVFQSGDATPLGMTNREITRLVPTTVRKWQSPKVNDKRGAVEVTFVATYRYTRGDP